MFMNRVQDLIDQDIMSFTEEKPNVKNNLLPDHGGPTVNVVPKEEETKMASLVGDLKTLLSVISINLQKHGILAGVHDNGDVCKTDPDKYEKLRGCVKELMNQGVIQFARARAVEEVYVIEIIKIMYYKKKIKVLMKKIQPINIRVPTPFPYQDSKEVPWKYDATIYVGGKGIQFSDAKIVNIVGTCAMTHNGRMFAPTCTPKVIQAAVVVPTPQEGAYVVIPTIPFETPSSFMSKGASSTRNK